MREQVRQAIRELIVAAIVIFIFILIAALVISSNSGVDIATAFGTAIMEILTAGSGGVLGNALYVVIVFLTLGIIFYIFQNVIILLTELRVGGILMKISLASIKDHYIVCGAGRVGLHAAEKLKKAGKKVVVIENDCAKVEFMRKRGYTVIEGDCMSEEILEKAKVRQAKGLLACTGEDSKNIFLVLTSKDLNPRIKIATRLNDLKSREEFKRAGADLIIAPEITGGYELADRIIGAKK